MATDREIRAMEKKRQKEEIQKEKELNRSLIPMSKQTRIDTGIMGLQEQDSVFYLGHWKYLKIYKFQNRDFTDKKRESLIKVLSSITMNRVRITSFRRLSGNSKILFLSVYVMASGYADAKTEFDTFEKDAEEMISRALGLPLSIVSINDAVMMTQLNSTGQMKKFDMSSMSQKDSLKTYLFPGIEAKPDGFLFLPEVQKYVYTFMGTQFPTDLNYPYEGLLDMPCSLYSSIDFQVMTEEESEMFNLSLEQKYNLKLSGEKRRNINMTYLVGLIGESETDKEKQRQKMFTRFNDEEVILCPCAGDEEQVYQSICSLGLIDYHAMRNSNADVICRLLL